MVCGHHLSMQKVPFQIRFEVYLISYNGLLHPMEAIAHCVCESPLLPHLQEVVKQGCARVVQGGILGQYGNLMRTFVLRWMFKVCINRTKRTVAF